MKVYLPEYRLFVDECGNVYREDGRLRKAKPGYYGYITIAYIDAYGNHKCIQAHRLVALAFIPNPENKRCVNHIDGDRANNNVDNLEWVTHQENTIHMYKRLRVFA